MRPRILQLANVVTEDPASLFIAEANLLIIKFQFMEEVFNLTLESPYDLILEPGQNDVCTIMQATIIPPWDTAFIQCQHYRNYLKSLPVTDPKSKIRSYVLTKADLDDLFAQDSKTIDAIRIYIGHEPVGTSYAVRLFVVGCKKNGINYDDWEIPLPGQQTGIKSILGEARPCPDECGTDDAMSADINTP
jgi:hypothetical protein